MRWISGALLALLTLAPVNLVAQGPMDSGLTAWAGYCGPDRAFGLKFGSREQVGMHLSVISTLVQLPAAYRPFDNAELVVSLKGRRRHTIHGQADFDSELRAQDALARLRSTLLSSGWLASAPEGGILYSDKKAMDDARPRGSVAELFTLGSRLYFSCSDAALMRQAKKEMPAPSAASSR